MSQSEAKLKSSTELETARSSKLIDDLFDKTILDVKAFSPPLSPPPLYYDLAASPYVNRNLPESPTHMAAKSPKLQPRNLSLNPFNTYSVHEYVTLEFSNPLLMNPSKLLSRERKPIPIVDPETKQVLNASQISLTQSLSQSNSIDLQQEIQQHQAQQLQQSSKQVKQAQTQPKSSPHVGRRDQTKDDQANVKIKNESAAKTNKRSETREQKNVVTTGTKTKTLPRAQSTIGATTRANNKNSNNTSPTFSKPATNKDTKTSKVASNAIATEKPKTVPKDPVKKPARSEISSPESVKSVSLKVNLSTNRKRYDKKFLLSLKDKNESKMFPDNLKGFEYASNEIISLESTEKTQIAPNEKSNIKSYAAAVATAVRPSQSLMQIKLPTSQPIQRSITRERVQVPEVSTRAKPINRAQSVSAANKQKVIESDKKTIPKSGIPVATSSQPRRTTSQVRSTSVAKHAPRAVDNRFNKPETTPRPESSLRNSKTYDVIPSVPLTEPIDHRDPKEEKLEQKLLPIFNQENLENYKEKFSNLKVEFEMENENKTETTNKMFVRALASALCLSCFDGRKLDIGSFVKRYFILKEFTRNDSILEIEVLKSIQALDHKLKHIPGFISVLFEIFFTEGFISEEIFFKWRDEPTQEGHNLSIYRLKEFFELLTDLSNNKLPKPMSKRNSTLSEETKSSLQKKGESIATSVSNTRKARIEKSRNKLNSILSNSSSSKVESTCSKCLQSISNLKKQNVQLMSTICGHIICKVCANRLLVNQTIECPTCKKNLDKTSIHDIFL